MKNFKILSILLITINFSHAQEITGDWYGTLDVQGTELPLVFHLQKIDSVYVSTMDSPKQGALGIKVDQTQYDNAHLEMNISKLGVTYGGIYDKNEEKINGTFKQGAMSLSLNLTREKKLKK